MREINVLNVGDNVTVKVLNPSYDVKHLYSSNYYAPRYHVYSGTFVKEKWFDHDEIGLTTGNPRFPVRRIQISRILEVNDARVDLTNKTQQADFSETVVGSRGDIYVVSRKNGKMNCTCPGFSYHKSCRHVKQKKEF